MLGSLWRFASSRAVGAWTKTHFLAPAPLTPLQTGTVPGGISRRCCKGFYCLPLNVHLLHLPLKQLLGFGSVNHDLLQLIVRTTTCWLYSPLLLRHIVTLTPTPLDTSVMPSVRRRSLSSYNEAHHVAALAHMYQLHRCLVANGVSSQHQHRVRGLRAMIPYVADGFLHLMFFPIHVVGSKCHWG